ncbi:hypothetical protein AX17_003269 [Amanita inopinata Kibby_2008]|nr:hypothetical protein AX17_003269 [Amanita inopinata Kibby_2008]
MLPQHSTVLVVGAGPSGLAAAISLLHHGCQDVIIVDAAETRPVSSRAIVVHAATLEALDTIGCADSLVDIGIKSNAAHINTTGGQLIKAEFSSLSPFTRYPFALIVSQYSTERVLEGKLEELGLSVQRPYKLVGLDDRGDAGIVASFESGETVRANYVIGADGARSAVRQLAGISFSDPDGELLEHKELSQIVLADITFASQLAPRVLRDEVFAHMSQGSFFFIIPIPKSPFPESYDHTDEPVYRIGFNVPLAAGPPPASPSIEYLQERLDRQNPIPVTADNSANLQPVRIAKNLWSTRFRTHAAIADKFLLRFHSQEQDTRRIIFLVGDAAHIHSPIGGQGMNLGLRDAVGLGPAVVKHQELFSHDRKGADQTFEEYAAMRYDRALKTIALTKRGMSIISTIGSGGLIHLFYWIIKLLARIPAVRDAFVWRASGLGNR